jgi:hypothetical protein
MGVLTRMFPGRAELPLDLAMESFLPFVDQRDEEIVLCISFGK